MLGRSLGFERLANVLDRNMRIDDRIALQNDEEYDNKFMKKMKTFAPGTKVLRVRHNKFSKLDTNYKPEVLKVIATFNDDTCQLADEFGRVLKRR
ncbi:hypothetical protein BD560DRAFT_306218, partial [Blakeslea trispora]